MLSISKSKNTEDLTVDTTMYIGSVSKQFCAAAIMLLRDQGNLRLLVDRIIIFEKDIKLKIKIKLNAKFQRHKDCYDENGNLTEKSVYRIIRHTHSRLMKVCMPYYYFPVHKEIILADA